jgi:hypothetical protein
MRGYPLAANVFAALLAMLFTYVTGAGGDESHAPSAACLQLLADLAGSDHSVEERERLSRLVLAMPRQQYLERSAVSFMERQGYKQTEIMGPMALDELGSTRLLAFRDGKTYALSLPAIDAPLFPGLYWSLGLGSAWTVIKPNGETTTYWVDREW